MERKQLWKRVAILELVIIIILIGYNIFQIATPSFAPQTYSPDKVNKKYGVCRARLPNPVIDSNFIKVEVSLKGKSLSISEFEWNDTNYVSQPGCFRANADQTEHTMSNFMHHVKQDSLVPFYIKIRSRANDNDYEYSLKVYNLKNQVIGKYPEASESVKAKVNFIGSPVVLAENIKIKNQ